MAGDRPPRGAQAHDRFGGSAQAPRPGPASQGQDRGKGRGLSCPAQGTRPLHRCTGISPLDEPDQGLATLLSEHLIQGRIAQQGGLVHTKPHDQPAHRRQMPTPGSRDEVPGRVLSKLRDNAAHARLSSSCMSRHPSGSSATASVSCRAIARSPSSHRLSGAPFGGGFRRNLQCVSSSPRPHSAARSPRSARCPSTAKTASNEVSMGNGGNASGGSAPESAGREEPPVGESVARSEPAVAPDDAPGSIGASEAASGTSSAVRQSNAIAISAAQNASAMERGRGIQESQGAQGTQSSAQCSCPAKCSALGQPLGLRLHS